MYVFRVGFSFAQILIATRLDLNHTRLSSDVAETEVVSSKTVTKVVFFGLVLALIIGVLSIIIYVFANTSILAIIQKFNIKTAYAYIIPAIICLVYLIYAVVYYVRNINKSFDSVGN